LKNFNRKHLKYLILTSLLGLVAGSLLFALPLMAAKDVASTLQNENHQQAIEAWRAWRHERLVQPDGWLTLVGLEWLKDGENRVGSAADNDIQ
jgi:hypothetical protein